MRRRSKGSLAIRVDWQLVPAKISLAQVPFPAKRKYPFWCTLVMGLAPARDWLVPLLGFSDEHDGGELSIEHSIYM
jgi:hypothetical protein